MYFSQFPKIYYDFVQTTGDNKLQILTDITTNVRIRKAILENITIYDEYDIKDGETIEIIAEKVYGNPELHWIIMLANQKYDYLKDFPMSSAELEKHAIDLYGADHLDDIHHYEKDGIIVEARATIKVPHTTLTQINVHDFILAEPVVNSRVESINLVQGTVEVMIDHGTFKPSVFLTVNGIRVDEESGNRVYTTVANFVLPTNGFILSDVYSVITNYQHEVRENEKKRRIKLISRNLVDQIVKEFKQLVTP